MNRVPLQSNDNAAEGVLYMAMELGDKRWKLVFSDGGAKRRHETVEAGRPYKDLGDHGRMLDVDLEHSGGHHTSAWRLKPC